MLYKHIKVDEAVKQHAELLKKLRESNKADIEQDPDQFNDDLFLVRFCISHKGDFEKTSHALKTAIAWRVKNKEILAKLATGEARHPDEITVGRYSPVGLHGQTRDHSPIFIIQGGIGNIDLLMQRCTTEEITNAVVFSKEYVHQICDRETRKHGYIVKMISIQNMKHGSIFDMNRAFLGVVGEASKQMELCYPQLLGQVCVVNPLSTIKIMLTLAQLILPSSTFEKIRLCGGKSTVTGDISTCPVASFIFDLEKLPTFLGGKCTCAGKGGCIGGIPNDRKEKVNPDEVQK